MAQVLSNPPLAGYPAAGPAPAGALLPGLRRAGPADARHGGGPHPPPQGGLEPVRRPGQSAKPLPLLPQPQDDGGKPGESGRFLMALADLSGLSLGRAQAGPGARGRGRARGTQLRYRAESPWAATGWERYGSSFGYFSFKKSTSPHPKKVSVERRQTAPTPRCGIFSPQNITKGANPNGRSQTTPGGAGGQGPQAPH